MKLSILPVKVLLRKKPKFKRRRKSSKKRVARPRPSPHYCAEMDTASGTEGEINDSTSSMSCFNEFETFADEVSGEIPEVDCRGRIKSEKFLSDFDDTASLLNQSQIIKADRTPSFLKLYDEDVALVNVISGQITSLLSPRTPYEDFHRLFKTVPKDQFPINDFSCALSREILLQGRIYISQGWFCFYSNIFGWETQVTIDCRKIQSITREKTAYVVPNAILICTDEEKHFFSSFLSRETVYKLLLQVWDEIKGKKEKTDKAKEDNQKHVSASGPSESKETPGEECELKNTGEENDLTAGHSCTADHKDEELIGCSKCQQTRQTAAEGLTSDPTEDEHSFKSAGSSKTLPQSTKDQQTSTESARITSWGGSKQPQISRTLRRVLAGPVFESAANSGIAMLVASIAETVYSYLQVSVRLIHRLTMEQLFYITTSILIICLMICSLFLLHRISILEPKIMASTAYPPEKVLLRQSMHQLWKLRQEVFDAEVVRFKTIVAANLNAITQVRKTLKMLENDLEAHMSRNCTLLDDNVCVQM